MKAAVLYEPRKIVVEDLELQGPGPGEVLVKLAASGVCHSDLSRVTGDRPLPMPIVLGHEGAGVVEKVGPMRQVPLLCLRKAQSLCHRGCEWC